MELGERIFYDQDGEIILELAKRKGDILPYKNITKVEYVDLEYNQVDTQNYRIIGVDTKTKTPILQKIEIVLSDEEKKIQELENQLLVSENNNLGGIL